MTDQQQARFEGWAVVDVMGHQRYAGYVTTEAYGQAVLFRIDVPALDERQRITSGPEYLRAGSEYAGYAPAGTSVKEGAVQGYTKLVGSGSIYMITPCTKDAALRAVEDLQPRPLMSVAVPPDRALAAGAADGEEIDDAPVLDNDNDSDQQTSD